MSVEPAGHQYRASIQALVNRKIERLVAGKYCCLVRCPAVAMAWIGPRSLLLEARSPGGGVLQVHYEHG